MSLAVCMAKMDGSEAMCDLLSFGIAAVDELITLETFPSPGSKIRIQPPVRQGGGLAATALVTAARLGCRCVYAGKLGINEPSEYIRRILLQEGIEIHSPQGYPEARPYQSYIWVEASTGERTILYSAPGVHGVEPEDVDETLVAGARMVLVDQSGPRGTLEICRLAKAHGIPIVADLDRVDHEDLRQIIHYTDHLILSAHIARELSEIEDLVQAVCYLAYPKRACTAVTDGARGCWFITEGDVERVQHQSAFEVKVCDTTGCGDVFHGAYCAALLSGENVANAMRFAAAVAALKATSFGGQAGIPDRRTVEGFLAGAIEA